MENESALDRQFREIVADCDFGEISTEQRILRASFDEQLIAAVRNMIAAYTAMVANLFEPSEKFEKYHDDAQQRLTEVTINIQFSYGLSEEDTLKVVELARVAIARRQELD